MSQKTSKLQIATWIEAGLATIGVREHRLAYISDGRDNEDKICRACGLGLAAIGKYGSVERAINIFDKLDRPSLNPTKVLAMMLEIPYQDARKIEHMHLHGGVSAAEIAQRLREED